jgi:hypothetical protein
MIIDEHSQEELYSAINSEFMNFATILKNIHQPSLVAHLGKINQKFIEYAQNARLLAEQKPKELSNNGI